MLWLLLLNMKNQNGLLLSLKKNVKTNLHY
jgi:hypothetical protein